MCFCLCLSSSETKRNAQLTEGYIFHLMSLLPCCFVVCWLLLYCYCWLINHGCHLYCNCFWLICLLKCFWMSSSDWLSGHCSAHERTETMKILHCYVWVTFSHFFSYKVEVSFIFPPWVLPIRLCTVCPTWLVEVTESAVREKTDTTPGGKSLTYGVHLLSVTVLLKWHEFKSITMTQLHSRKCPVL